MGEHFYIFPYAEKILSVDSEYIYLQISSSSMARDFYQWQYLDDNGKWIDYTNGYSYFDGGIIIPKKDDKLNWRKVYVDYLE
jgi:hypothetical protein